MRHNSASASSARTVSSRRANSTTLQWVVRNARPPPLGASEFRAEVMADRGNGFSKPDFGGIVKSRIWPQSQNEVRCTKKRFRRAPTRLKRKPTMSVLVKICGLTNLPDAEAAVAAGADLLGFVFASVSPR